MLRCTTRQSPPHIWQVAHKLACLPQETEARVHANQRACPRRDLPVVSCAMSDLSCMLCSLSTQSR